MYKCLLKHNSFRMDFLNSLFKREIGRKTSTSYDMAIKLLKCYDCNDFNGIQPSEVGQSYNSESPAFACRFSCKTNYQHLLALANEDGMLAVQDTNIRNKLSFPGENYIEGIQAHNNAIFDLAWMEGELNLVSVSGDHTAVLWDVNTVPFAQVRCFKGHTRSVKTVAFKPHDKAVFATGARDGVIMVWDIRSNRGLSRDKPDNFISNSHHSGSPCNVSSRSRRNKSSSIRAKSITSLVFQNEDCLISCGAGDGLIKIWDLRKNYSAYKREPLPCYTLPYPGNTAQNGFTNLLLDPGKLKLYASCMDSVIYCYNVATFNPKPVSTFIGHQVSSFYVKSCLSPDGLYLMSGSSDQSAYIWNTNGSQKPVTSLVGHGAEVTCVEWCPVGEPKLVTCSDDARHRIWHVGSCVNDGVILVRGWVETPKEKLSHCKETLEILDQLEDTTPITLKACVNQQQRTPVQSGSLQDATNVIINEQFTIPSDNNNRTSKRRLEDFFGNNPNSSSETGMGQVLPLAKEGNWDGKVLSVTEKYNISDPLHSPSSVTDSHVPCEIRQNLNKIILSSPTTNLPNFVLDGTSPHHYCTPNKQVKENVDWLTKLRNRKINSDEKVSPRTPKRRYSHTRSHESNRESSSKEASESLLRFVRVGGKPKGEMHSCSGVQLESNVKVKTVEP